MNAHLDDETLDAELAHKALDAAESILRYTPHFSTNCGGTKPGMTTHEALRLVRAALANIEAARSRASDEYESLKIAAE